MEVVIPESSQHMQQLNTQMITNHTRIDKEKETKEKKQKQKITPIRRNRKKKLNFPG